MFKRSRKKNKKVKLYPFLCGTVSMSINVHTSYGWPITPWKINAAKVNKSNSSECIELCDGNNNLLVEF